MDGLFDLSFLEDADLDDDDIDVDLELSESTQEFVDHCASYDPTKLWDPDNSRDFGPPINKDNVILDSDTYNKAITQLQRSFKEGYEIMGMLANANVTSGRRRSSDSSFLDDDDDFDW